MKKILAGILAAVSMLSVSATAFATDKTVTKPGEVEYDVSVTSPAIVLNLVMPAKISAALNPYGADLVILKGDTADEDVTAKNGIVGTAYKITNKSKDYGVYIDATATVTPSTGIVVKGTTVAGDDDDNKEACMGLVGLSTAPTKTKGFTLATSTAATGTAQGSLVLDSTVEADKEAGVAKATTSQKKFMYMKAATDDADTDAYMAFVGELEGGDDIEWTEDDTIEVSLILKVTAGPKTFPTP